MSNFFRVGRYFPQSWRLFSLAVALTCFGGVANAQTDEDESEAVDLADTGAGEALEEIVVTGSRLKRDTFTSVCYCAGHSHEYNGSLRSAEYSWRINGI
jgi:hypothetical protein